MAAARFFRVLHRRPTYQVQQQQARSEAGLAVLFSETDDGAARKGFLVAVNLP
jgi:hypothetical protein